MSINGLKKEKEIIRVFLERHQSIRIEKKAMFLENKKKVPQKKRKIKQKMVWNGSTFIIEL